MLASSSLFTTAPATSCLPAVLLSECRLRRCSPITRHFGSAQGNATGALLHEQYIQSLFAAAADGLLHSPASLLSLAAPTGAADAAVVADVYVPCQGPADTPQGAATAEDGSGPGAATTSPALTQVWSVAAVPICRPWNPDAAVHAAKPEAIRRLWRHANRRHTFLLILDALLAQEQLAQLLDLSEDEDEEDVDVLGGSPPAPLLHSLAAGIAIRGSAAELGGSGTGNGGAAAGSGGRDSAAIDATTSGARNRTRRKTGRKGRKGRQQHEQVRCRTAFSGSTSADVHSQK
jgi:hypothetical protein